MPTSPLNLDLGIKKEKGGTNIYSKDYIPTSPLIFTRERRDDELLTKLWLLFSLIGLKKFPSLLRASG
jgi:hypothetical protein